MPPERPIDRLVAIMRRLRDPVSGCEWDSVQNFATIAPYTIEEAYEVADAIARNDMDALADELGDLQLQVVFHAQMAEEAGHFALDDVVTRICDKLENVIKTDGAERFEGPWNTPSMLLPSGSNKKAAK